MVKFRWGPCYHLNTEASNPPSSFVLNEVPSSALRNSMQNKIGRVPFHKSQAG
jgi:hypothetical protein